MPTRHHRYQVDGMICAACSARVERALNKLDGGPVASARSISSCTRAAATRGQSTWVALAVLAVTVRGRWTGRSLRLEIEVELAADLSPGAAHTPRGPGRGRGDCGCRP